MSSPVGRVEVELGRVLTRLAALGPARLARPGAGSPRSGQPSPVELVRPVLQRLADLAARGEGQPARPVPALELHALGDQLAVLARDVLAVPPGAVDPAALDDVADHLTALRRALP